MTNQVSPRLFTRSDHRDLHQLELKDLPVPSDVRGMHLVVNTVLRHLQTNDKEFLSPSLITRIKEAKIAYTKIARAYCLRRISVAKVFNRFKPGQAKKISIQLDCIKKIVKIERLWRYGADWNYTQKVNLALKRSSLRKVVQANINSNKFLKLFYYSLHDPDELTLEQKEDFEDVESTIPFSTEVFIVKQLEIFQKNATEITSEDKSACTALLKAFEFCKKMSWKVKQYQHLDFYKRRSWHLADSGAAFQYALKKLKVGEEIAIPAWHLALGQDRGHEELFVFGKYSQEICYCNEYNTGLGAIIDHLDPTKTIVKRTFFKTNALLSNEFGNIFSQELLNFEEINAESDDDPFQRFEAFKKQYQIEEEQIKNCPEQPESISTQIVGNCGFASKISYIRQKMGPVLFAQFKEFMIDSTYKTLSLQSRKEVFLDLRQLKNKLESRDLEIDRNIYRKYQYDEIETNAEGMYKIIVSCTLDNIYKILQSLQSLRSRLVLLLGCALTKKDKLRIACLLIVFKIRNSSSDIQELLNSDPNLNKFFREILDSVDDPLVRQRLLSLVS